MPKRQEKKDLFIHVCRDHSQRDQCKLAENMFIRDLKVTRSVFWTGFSILKKKSQSLNRPWILKKDSARYIFHILRKCPHGGHHRDEERLVQRFGFS